MYTNIYAWLVDDIRISTDHYDVLHSTMSETRTVALHVRVSPGTQAALQNVASAEHRKVATLIAIMIEEGLYARAAEPKQ